MSEKQLLADCLQLQQSFASLLLSTSSQDGEPLASFSPYVLEKGSFYIFVSELAAHTRNMQFNPRASVLFIESEASAKNLYARRRAVVQVSVHSVDDESEASDAILLKMRDRHGATVNLLSSLADFKLLELRPIRGRYVVGFGKAYDWDVKANTMTHVSAELVRESKE